MPTPWRQRMAGLRTNALVASGAAMFVMCVTVSSPWLRETHLSSSRKKGSRGANQFVRWDLCSRRGNSHSLVFFVYSVRASGSSRVRGSRLAVHRVPGNRCYPEVPVLVFYFPYILVLLCFSCPTRSG